MRGLYESGLIPGVIQALRKRWTDLRGAYMRRNTASAIILQTTCCNAMTTAKIHLYYPQNIIQATFHDLYIQTEIFLRSIQGFP